MQLIENTELTYILIGETGPARQPLQKKCCQDSRQIFIVRFRNGSLGKSLGKVLIEGV